MQLGTFGKITGLFLVVNILLAWMLGLGSVGILSQLQTTVAMNPVLADTPSSSQETTSQNSHAWQRARIGILLYTLVSTAALMVVGVLVLRHWLYRPLARLVEGVDRIVTEGPLDHPLCISDSSDLGHVAQGINQIAETLRQLSSEVNDGLSGKGTTPLTTPERDDFLAIVSHDLKAPLRGIKSLAQWLEQDYGDRLGDAGCEQIQLLVRRVQRMENLIHALLTYTRSDRSNVAVEVVDLQSLVSDTLEELYVPEHITVEIPQPLPTIHSDAMCLHQIFQNLLSNAVKYMDKESGLVRVTAREMETGHWEFRVQDNGPGIAPKYHDKVFEMFETLSPRDQIESTGVGLALVKQCLCKLGGQISIESDEGQGSTFIFTVPNAIEERLDHEEHKTCTAGGR